MTWPVVLHVACDKQMCSLPTRLFFPGVAKKAFHDVIVSLVLASTTDVSFNSSSLSSPVGTSPYTGQ